LPSIAGEIGGKIGINKSWGLRKSVALVGFAYGDNIEKLEGINSVVNLVYLAYIYG
tara:strand:- start:583 stop:750 length:168 start_codon:yes stop_codon:yes gene_type:complete